MKYYFRELRRRTYAHVARFFRVRVGSNGAGGHNNGIVIYVNGTRDVRFDSISTWDSDGMLRDKFQCSKDIAVNPLSRRISRKTENCNRAHLQSKILHYHSNDKFLST